jgi:hypothetical protein
VTPDAVRIEYAPICAAEWRMLEYGSPSTPTFLKTTVEISDELARSIRILALEEGTMMRALIEAGLRRVLEEHTHALPSG